MKSDFSVFNRIFRRVAVRQWLLCCSLLLSTAGSGFTGEAGNVQPRSFFLGLTAGGQLSNLSDSGVTEHLAVVEDLPLIDTMPEGTYEYMPYGTLLGFRVGAVMVIPLVRSLDLSAHLCYTRKGETVRFVTELASKISVQTDYIELCALARWHPGILAQVNMSLQLGGYAGVLAQAREVLSLHTADHTLPIRIRQEYSLRPWLDGIDAGIAFGCGLAPGAGVRRLGIDLLGFAGLTDIRGSHRRNNNLFPGSMRQLCFSLAVTYLVNVMDLR